MSIKELKLSVILKTKHFFSFKGFNSNFRINWENYASIGIIFLNTPLCISLIKRSKVSRLRN